MAFLAAVTRLFFPGVAIAFFLLSAATAQEEEQPAVEVKWSQTDTRLANHYISLLQKDPSYGKVFDLLWDLYGKKNQVPLLLEYFRNSAEAEDPKGGVATLLYAHLLRKNEQIEEARNFYSLVLDSDPDSIPALKATAEIADQQKRVSKALSNYTRLVKLIPVQTEDGVAIRLRKAILQKEQGQTEEAVATWQELLQAYPGNVALRTEIVGMLLEAGETDSAIDVLQDLVEQNDPQKKLTAILELNRLYEFISDFENAVSTARDGMKLVHFKDHQHEELFSRLVRAHERFDRLSELEQTLRDKAEVENPTERDLYLLVQFYRQTANTREEEKAMARLSSLLPQDLDYRVRLAEVQMENDNYEAAAATLDQVLETQPEVPLRLILLRARVALNDEEPKVAEQILQDYLAKYPGDPDVSRSVLEFARSFYLDELVEGMLRQQSAGVVAGSDGESAPLDLARFLQERGRQEQAVETLHAYAETEGLASTERARRMQQISTAFREIDLPDEALAAAEKAIELAPGNFDYLNTKADILIDRRQIDEAVEVLEEVLAGNREIEKRAEIDQKIFTLLRGFYSKDEVDPNAKILNSGNIQTLSEYRKLAAAVSQSKRQTEQGPPPEVMQYFTRVKNEANQNPSVASRYRAAWWAFKLQDTRECFFHLSAAKAEAKEPHPDVEKMLLEMAEQQERPALMVKHLETLAEIDPDNAEDYLQKRAFVRFQLGWEDEAIRDLQKMASHPDASLNTLNTLAKAYKMQGSTTKHIDVWRAAFRKANIFEKRRIIKQLATALIETNQPEEAIKAQLDLIVRETDPVQRRKQLDAQLTTAQSHSLLPWLQDRYQELAQREPFDRFFPEALAKVHRAAGNDAEAFAAMKKAYYLSGQSEELLDELGELAGQLGDLQSAIYYRRQIIARAEGETTIENWGSLIEMLEKDLRIGEADLLRRRLETKFGQDTDFLGQLATYYRDNNQYTSAIRVLEKLVALRSWDLHATLELGLLKAKSGDRRGALALFETVISASEGEPLPEKYTAREIWPIIHSPRVGDPDSGEDRLRELAITVESFPARNSSLPFAETQERISDWLQDSHPEFSLLPRAKYFLRLRAIEEAAQLLAETGETDQWLARWEERDSSQWREKLWAFRYARLHDATLAVLTETAQEKEDWEVSANLPWLTLIRFLARDGDITAPLGGEENTPNPDRSYFATMAALFWLRNLTDTEKGVDFDYVASFLRERNIDPTLGTHTFSELRRAGKIEEAFLVAEVLHEQETLLEGASIFQISQVAGWAGDESARYEMLAEAIQRMTRTGGSRVPPQYYPALTEMFSLLETDAERETFAAETQALLEKGGAKDSSSAIEKRMLISLALGKQADADYYLSLLAKDIVGQVQHQRIMIGSATPRYRTGPNWADMNSLLKRSSRVFALKDRDSIFNFSNAISGDWPIAVNDEHSRIEFELFQIGRFGWELEHRDSGERSEMLNRFFSSLEHPGSATELARVLQERGFQREAASVLHEHSTRDAQEYAPLRSFFESCFEAMDPDPALRVLDQLENREIPTPPGLTVDYLHDQRARFLFHKRDIARLEQLGKAPTLDDDNNPLRIDIGTGHLPYQYALIRAYEQAGDHEDELLQLLDSTSTTGRGIEKARLLTGAILLSQQDRTEEAVSWLKRITFDGTESSVEQEALSELFELANDQANGALELLLELSQTILETQKPETTIQLTETLSAAGQSREAEGLLRLLFRKVSNPITRQNILVHLVSNRVTSSDTWDESIQDLETFFSLIDLRRESSSASLLIQLWVSHPPVESDATAVELLKRLTSHSESGWLAKLLLAFQEDSLPEVAEAILTDPNLEKDQWEMIAETLLAFGKSGESIVAKLVQDSGRPGNDFFPQQPERQIAFFTSIRDLPRLHEVHQSLWNEAGSAMFFQSDLQSIFPTMIRRREVPRLFQEAGYPDLAGSLYRRYLSGISSFGWANAHVLEDYLAFLVDQNEFEEAESWFRKLSRKSLRIDLRLLMTMYQKWGKLDDWEARTASFEYTEGQRNLLQEWRTALAEGKEMVQYRPYWRK